MKRESREAAEPWMEKAASDLQACDILLAAEEQLFAIVCFHTQQAAEKAMKALLTAHAIPFPKTHDLVLLASLMPEQTTVGVSIEALVELSYFAVSPRYPDDLVEITRPLAARLAENARTVYASVQERLREA